MAELKTCVACGAQGTRDDGFESEYKIAPNPENTERYQWDDFCEKCWVDRWLCSIHLIFHRDIPQSVVTHFRNKRILALLRKWFHNKEYFPVHFFHRRDMETIGWNFKYDSAQNPHNTKPPQPYTYRGYCSYDKIVIFYDETETLDSLEWIFYHELGHHECQKYAKMIDAAMDKENKNNKMEGYDWVDDDAHEADAEEKLVNRIATAFMDGREYARPWWRPRVEAFKAGLPMPDPHAPHEDPLVEHVADALKKAKEKFPKEEKGGLILNDQEYTRTIKDSPTKGNITVAQARKAVRDYVKQNGNPYEPKGLPQIRALNKHHVNATGPYSTRKPKKK